MNTKVYIALFSLLLFSQSWAQQDVGVSQINNPTSGCQVGVASTSLNVIVRNYSPTFAFPNTITVKYTINAGPVHSELIGALLGPNASFNFTFFQTENFSACGNYQFKIWTTKAGDPNPTNDTLNYLFKNDCNPIPGTITGPNLLCYGINNDSLKVAGGTFAYSHQWYKQSPIPGTFNATGNLSNTLYINGLIDTSAYYVRYQGGFCPAVNSAPFGVGISPTVVTGSISPDLSVCVDNVFGNVSVSGFTQNVTDWEQSNNGGLTWIPTGNAIPSLNINYLTSSALFRAKVASGACGTKYSDTISVEVQPLIIPGNITGATNVCFGVNTTNLTLTGNANDYGFEWYSSIDNVTFTPTGITTTTFTATNLTQNTYYKVVLQGDQCSDSETPVVIIVVDLPVNIGTVTPDTTICSNSNASITISGYNAVIDDWEQSNDGGLTWFSTGDNSPSHSIFGLSNSALFRAIVSSGACGSSYSDTVSVTVETAILPGVISGSQVVCSGSNNDTLAILGYANQLGLEWYTATLASPTYVPTGITNDTLITSNVTTTTYYYVVLTGNVCPQDTTSEVYVQVDPPLAFGTGSPDLFMCSNSVSGFVSVPGYSSNLVDWEQSNDGGLTWFSTNDSSDFYDLTSLTNSADFRALISSGACGSGYSDTISVTIENAIIPGTVSSSNAVCNNINSDTLVLSGNLNQISLEWYSSIDNSTFTSTGISNDTLITSNLNQTTYFKVLHTGNFCPNIQTNVVTIQVDSNLNLGTVSPNLQLCSTNISGGVYLSNFSSTLIDWEQSDDGGNTWFSTGNNSTVHGISYLTDSASFRALIDAGACGSGYSDTITVDIQNSIIPGTIIAASNNVCNGSNSDTLILVGHANEISLEWYSSPDNVNFTPTGITGDTLITSNITQPTYYRVFLEGDFCANSVSNSVFIQIDPPLNLGIISPDLFLCSSNIAGDVYLANYSTTLVDWEQSDDGGATWYSLGTNSSVFSISYLTASASFRATVSSATCGVGISDTVNVTIEPAVVPGTVTYNGSTVCYGANSDTLVVSGYTNGIGLEWYSSIDNVTFTPTGITSDTLITPNITQSTYYKVIVNGNYCPNLSTNSVLVQVSPALNVGTISSDLILCSNNVSGYVFLTNYTLTLVSWEQSNNGGTTWFPTGSNAQYHDISYLTASALFRAVVTNGGCGTGISDTISVTVLNSIVPGSISATTSSVCSGNNSDTLALVGYANANAFEWFSSTDNSTFTSTGITNDTLITSNITQSLYYKVVLQSSAGCASAQSASIYIQVDSALNLGTISPDLILCSNNVFGGVYLSNYMSVLLDWEQSDDGGLTWFSTGNNSAVHGISYLTASASFRAIISSGACGTGISDTIEVEIENAIIPGTITGLNSVCAGINSDTLVLSGYTSQANIEWYSSTDNVNFTPTGVTNDTLIFTNLTQPTYYKVILFGNACPNSQTSVFLVDVNLPLNLGTLSPDLTLCSSNIAGNFTLSNFSSTIMDWEQSNDGGLTWFSTGINSPILDISFLTDSASFRAIVSSGSCGSGISDTGNVFIEPAIIPGVITGDTLLCYGNNIDTLVYSGYANTSNLQWYTTTTNTSYLPTGNSTDTLILSNLIQTTYVKVVHLGNVCPDVQTQDFIIQLAPAVVTGIPSPDLYLCETNIVGSVTLINYSSTIDDWEQSNDGGNTWFSTNSNSPIHDISYLTASAKFRAIVSSSLCGSAISDTISVYIEPQGTPASIGFDFSACVGSPDLDSMKVLSYSGTLFHWQTSVDSGATWNILPNSDSILYVNFLAGNTIYQLITSHGACPNVNSNTITATVNPVPSVSAGTDTTIYEYNSVQLNGSGGAFGIWTPANFLSDPTLQSPLSTPPQTIIYGYTVIDINGCTNTDYVQVTVLPDSTGFPFIIYNIITPNGDGKNDFLFIKGLNTVDKYLINIFNPNGNLIFQSDDYNNDWGGTYNGQIVPDGTYLYAVEINDLTKYRGFLTIMKGID